MLQSRDFWHQVRRATRERSPRGIIWTRRPTDVGALLADEAPRGAKTATREKAIRLARWRAEMAKPLPETPGVDGRLRARRLRHLENEIIRRGLPLRLDLARNGDEPLSVVDYQPGPQWIMLAGAEGWADYGRRHGSRFRSLRILGGMDDGGMWAVRVPGTIDEVPEALAWLEPAEVQRARRDGLRVLRQGDVWVVEMIRDRAAHSPLPMGHRWDADSRTLWHNEHQPLHVPFPAKFIPQRTLAADGVGRTRAD